MIRRVAALTLFLLLVGAPANAQQPLVQIVEEHDNARGEIDKTPGDFVHRASGYAFPATLGEMPARKTITYGPGDAAVNYTLYGGGNGDPWIDLYVYPAGQGIDDEAAGVEASIIENFRPTKVESPAGLPPGPADSRDGWFQGAIGDIPVLSGYRVARAGNWFIKVRVSIPARGGDEGIARAMRGIAAVPWSLPAPVQASVSALSR